MYVHTVALRKNYVLQGLRTAIPKNPFTINQIFQLHKSEKPAEMYDINLDIRILLQSSAPAWQALLRACQYFSLITSKRMEHLDIVHFYQAGFNEALQLSRKTAPLVAPKE
jgi:hypothetical protein